MSKVEDKAMQITYALGSILVIALCIFGFVFILFKFL